jgi:hypothetical protein
VHTLLDGASPWRSSKVRPCLYVRPLLLASQAKVCELEGAALVDEKILWLDVAVHNVAEMQIPMARGNSVSRSKEMSGKTPRKIALDHAEIVMIAG